MTEAQAHKHGPLYETQRTNSNRDPEHSLTSPYAKSPRLVTGYLAGQAANHLETEQASQPRRHRTVKSISRDINGRAHQANLTSSGDDNPAQIGALHVDTLRRSETDSELYQRPQPQDKFGRVTTTFKKSDTISPVSDSSSDRDSSSRQRASVLLASGTYPSTLQNTSHAYTQRPRTISSGSVSPGAIDRSPTLKLASAAYPSSYQPALPISSTHLSPANRPSALPSPRPLPLPSKAPAQANLSAEPLSPPQPRGGQIDSMSRSKAPESRSDLSALPSLNVSFDQSIIGEEGEDTLDAEELDEVGELSHSSTSSFKSLGQMSPAERRDHSRKHSRVHSRNLSVFFPRPGSEAEREADQARAGDHFGPITTNGLSPIKPEDYEDGGGISPTKSRKGHHRKHSVTHGLYSTSSTRTEFPLDGNSEKHRSGIPSMDRIDQNASADHARPAAQAYALHQRKSSTSVPVVAQLLSTPVWQLLADTSLPPAYRPLLLFGAFHFCLGAALWMHGQSGDSLAMTGLGYLVVFDAFGILSAVAAEWLTGKWRKGKDNMNHVKNDQTRRAYGPHRIETVLQFSQTVFLLFSAIYVCKESVEHALLEGTDEDHEQDDIGLSLPSVTLCLTLAACLFSNVVLQNHAKLVAACGISTAASEASTSTQRITRSHGRRGSILVDPSVMAGPFVQIFANPFSVSILFFSLTLTVASLLLPPFQVAALDKVLAGLESAAMLYVAYPASKALGKILLQTAPPAHSTQNVQLMRSLRTIEEHRQVVYVAPPHLWQLTPPTSALNAPAGRTLLLGQATSRTAKNASLIASVEIFVRDDTSDSDVLDITRWAWQLLAPSVGAGAGMEVGESLRGALRAGEVVVQVSRETERSRAREELKSCTHAHSHDKSEAHDHTHDGKHQHHHGHSDHPHDHDHNHDHDHHHHGHADHGHHHHDDHHHHHNHDEHDHHHHNHHQSQQQQPHHTHSTDIHDNHHHHHPEQQHAHKHIH